MCTLIVLHRCVPDRPLVVAANRDEFLDRPSEEPALRSSRTGPIVAPLDLEAGGTWVGVSARGVFAGLTNLRPGPSSMTEGSGSEDSEDSEDQPGGIAALAIEDHVAVQSALARRERRVKPELRSRGEVVMMALEAETAADAVRVLSKLTQGTYNPFQLLVADGNEAWLVVYRGSGRAVQLEPGPHILGNVVDERIEAELGTASLRPVGAAGLTADEGPRARKLTRIRARVEKLLTEPGRDYFEGLARICREHVEEIGTGGEGREEQSPFESACVHVANRYGTRSSFLLELSRDPAANRLWTTDGPPCERPYENRSSLLRELGVRLGNRAGTEPT